MKAIFSATDFELGEVLKSKTKYGFELVVREPFEVWKNSSTLVFVSGIGPVNAALCFAHAAKNFDFEYALNVGSAGALKENAHSLGEVCLPNKIICLDPYNQTEHAVDFDALSFDILKFFEDGNSRKISQGCVIASSARVTSSQADRADAALKCDIVDMEAYAHAHAAKLFKKEIAFIKFVSDFSADCNIHENILRLSRTLEDMPLLWT